MVYGNAGTLGEESKSYQIGGNSEREKETVETSIVVEE